ncbi:MAG: imidazole glycerol phosphate synthase subunit HisF [Candidatus Marinamargulisbacteria bacterium]
MITKRIIPCLDVDKGRVVKGTNFVNIRDAGDPVELAKKYANDGADELVFLDITASSDKRMILKDLIQKVAKEIFIPFTVGGGINSIGMIQDLLNLGADKVSLNTAALHNPLFIKEAADHFGSQCIVIAVDIKRIGSTPAKLFSNDNIYTGLASHSTTTCEVYSHGGRHNLGLDALKWIKFCEGLGAGEILLTSMDRDGTKDGYDTDMLQNVKELVNIPVIASGGAGTIQHIKHALDIGDAALLASLLHYGELTIQEIKQTLYNQGINVR